MSNPLDTTKFEQNPCGLLSNAQAQSIAELVRSRADTANVAGPGCQWNDSASYGLKVGFVRGSEGLQGIYGQHQAGRLAYFEPVPSVAGYPGAYGAVSDLRAQGTCTLVVAVKDDLAMSVISTFGLKSPHRNEACSVVQKAAEAAVTTMKGGT